MAAPGTIIEEKYNYEHLSLPKSLVDLTIKSDFYNELLEKLNYNYEHLKNLPKCLVDLTIGSESDKELLEKKI